MRELAVPQPARAAFASAPEFEGVFRDFAPYVLRVLPRLGVAARDVDDVAQEVFLAVFRALPGFEGRSKVKTWVYGICIRIAKNHVKRAYHRRERLDEPAAESTDSRSPASELESRRELAALDRALAELPEVQRITFVLHQIEALTVAEIAEVTGSSKFTIYARLYAARRRVLGVFGEQEGGFGS